MLASNDFTPYIIINGNLQPADNAGLPVNDLGLLRGYGVFDFWVMANGIPLFFEDHWQRLQQSAAALLLPLPFTREELLQQVAGLYEKMPYAYAGVRVTVTGGSSADGYSLAHIPNYLITLQPQAMPHGNYGEAALALKTFSYQRQLPQVKTIDYLMGIRLLQMAKHEGYNEVLYQQDGVISECPRANIFVLTRNEVLITPHAGILQGVTRSRVLQKAAGLMAVEVCPLTYDTLINAVEVFTTSTTRVMQRAGRIDQTALPATPHPLARQLYSLLLHDLQAAMA